MRHRIFPLRWPRDPRLYQIGILSSLLLYGLIGLDLEIRPEIATTLLMTALTSQWLATQLWRLPRFDPRSALITGLSLALLLRTQSPLLALLAASLAVLSKFVIRARGKHIFNPANFGLVTLALLTSWLDLERVWASPGQWGSAAWTVLLIAGLGMVVVRRAERSDITWGLLGAWAAVLFGRALWLGDPWAIPLKQLGSGAFLIFAFLMISDPKTTPDRRSGRLLYAALVAVVAGWIEFSLYRPNGLLLALYCCAPLVPLLDLLWRGVAYRWPSTNNHPPTLPISAAGRRLLEGAEHV